MFEANSIYPKYKLKDICDLAKGQQINADELSKEGKYPCYNGGIEPSGYWHEYNVEGESVSISEGGNSCGYVNYQKDNYWCGAHCYHLSNVSCNTYFLYCLLKTHQEDLMNLRSGSCMPNIKKTTLQNYEVVIPPMEQQISFAEFALQSDKSK